MMGPEETITLLAIGLLLVLGVFFAMGARRIGLPSVTGYFVAGLLVGLAPFELLTPSTSNCLSALKILASGYVSFAVGSRLHLAWLRRGLPTIAPVVCCSLVCATGLLIAGLVFIGHIGPSIGYLGGDALDGASWRAIFVLALILTAASPAIIVCVCDDRDYRGARARAALGACVLLGALVLLLIAGLDAEQTARTLGGRSGALSAFELTLCAAIGLSAGIFFVRRRGDSRILLATCFFAGVLMLAQVLALEPAVLAMSLLAGIARANFGRTSEEPFDHDSDTLRLAFVILFGATAAFADVGVSFTPLLLGLILVGLRALGLWLGTWSASLLVAQPRMRRDCFAALLPQGGFSLVLVSAVDDPTGSLRTLVLTVVLVNALVMPPAFDRALARDHSARPVDA